MILTKLQGGLGNQMFQYACARNLISKNQKVYLDLNFINNHIVSSSVFTARNYELNIFENCQTRILNSSKRKMFFDKRLRYRIIRRLFLKNIQFVNQLENEYINIDTKSKNIYLNGYFQSEKYFIKKRNLIINDFSFPTLDAINKQLLDQISNDINSVSIHVRRGDYLKKKVTEYHGCLPLSYYISSVNDLSNKFDDLKFYIFSDDKDFIESSFGFIKNKIIVSGNTGKHSWKDMCLMTYCKHHIIANSSFSWWGAWLSETDGITFAPRNWFNPQMAKFEINDIIPNNWIVVDYE